jgi:hypothetical protein
MIYNKLGNIIYLVYVSSFVLKISFFYIITPLKNRISLLHECFAVDYQQDDFLITKVLKS